jgi:hypothetical protein
MYTLSYNQVSILSQRIRCRQTGKRTYHTRWTQFRDTVTRTKPIQNRFKYQPTDTVATRRNIYLQVELVSERTSLLPVSPYHAKSLK